jgi:hypothetical protein
MAILRLQKDWLITSEIKNQVYSLGFYGIQYLLEC